MTSLAIGADQVFAEMVLKHKGELEVIIPFPGYEERFSAGSDRDAYFAFLAKAAKTLVLPPSSSDEASYYAAGRFIADRCDVLIAVWNGLPAKGLGGTADVVEYAKVIGKPIYHLNPTNRRLEIYGLPRAGSAN